LLRLFALIWNFKRIQLLLACTHVWKTRNWNAAFTFATTTRRVISDLSLLTHILRTMKFDIHYCVTWYSIHDTKIYNLVCDKTYLVIHPNWNLLLPPRFWETRDQTIPGYFLSRWPWHRVWEKIAWVRGCANTSLYIDIIYSYQQLHIRTNNVLCVTVRAYLNSFIHS
jgi:hypothetical protein